MSAITSSTPPEGQQQDKKMIPFRELPVRPRMVVPEWLPMKEDKEIKYKLSLVNGVYQMHQQEVGFGRLGVSIKEGFILASVSSFFCPLSVSKYACSNII